MPMKPHKDESRDDFVSRCMSEVFGSDAPEDRTQEQALAICFGYWKDAQKEKAYGDGDTLDCPDPEPNEDEEDYMDRCMEELGSDDAEDLCRAHWTEWMTEQLVLDARPGTTIYRTHAAPVQGSWFILSDESIDRLGEVITAKGWKLNNFQRNPIALFNHRSDFPIGRWHDLRVDDGALKGRLELAPAGTSPRIDEIRKLVEADILRAVSVGFRADKRELINEKSDPDFGPFRYTSQELVECSLVSVPANPNAIAVAKSLKISPATIDAVFAGSGKKIDVIKRRGFSGGSARSSSSNSDRRRSAMPLAQRIIDVQNQIVAKRDALAAHLEKIDDSNVSDADLQTTTDLNHEIAQLERSRIALVESEKNLADQLENDDQPKRPAVIRNVPAPVGLDRTRKPQMEPTIHKADKDLNFLDYMIRSATIAIGSKTIGRDVAEARNRIYGDHEPTRIMSDILLRAASAPALTTVTGWAAELVQQVYAAPMQILMPNAILTGLSARGLSLSFGRAGRINIPTRSRTPTIAGSFVGEGLAIPVRQGAFTTQPLTPKKLAVITTWSREMDEHSIPAIEGILREAIQQDTTVAVDTVLIDANAATVIRPAGLLNGVAGQTPTAGGGIAAVVGDLKLIIGALNTGTYGNIRNPVWLMNPASVLALQMITAANTGIFPFAAEARAGSLMGIPIISSSTVAVATVILVDAADFVVVDGGAPRFEISDQATLHMDDTNPAELVSTGSPAVTAAPQRSLFQTDSLALRMIMPLNWLQRRAGTIAWAAATTW